jgi:secreted trypsin-like serine protease
VVASSTRDGYFPRLFAFVTSTTDKNLCKSPKLSPKFTSSVFRSSKLSDLVVYADTTDSYTTEGVSRFVNQIIIHPNYKKTPEDVINNIALLKLRSALYTFWKPLLHASNIKPIKIGTIGIEAEVLALGWGSVRQNEEKEISPKLNYVTYVTKDSEKDGCQSSYEIVCAKSFIRDEGLCYYDAGGPLVDVSNGEDKLVGIVSHIYTNSCAAGHVEVFTRAASYVWWIMEETGIQLTPPKSNSFQLLSGITWYHLCYFNAN